MVLHISLILQRADVSFPHGSCASYPRAIRFLFTLYNHCKADIDVKEDLGSLHHSRDRSRRSDARAIHSSFISDDSFFWITKASIRGLALSNVPLCRMHACARLCNCGDTFAYPPVYIRPERSCDTDGPVMGGWEIAFR